MHASYVLGLLATLACTHALAVAQTPEPGIINFWPEQKPADSRTLSRQPMPAALRALGSMASNLTAYFPMDDTAMGCLAWSRKPMQVRATGELVIREQDGRKYADFSKAGARLIFDPALELGKHFTLAAWLEAVAPGKHGVIWHGTGALLFLLPNSLEYWVSNKGGVYGKTAEPLAGWHHVAVIFDGKKTQAFLDASPLEAYSGSVSGDLKTVGNHPENQHQHWMMAAGIDEQFFFDRPLSAEEIKKLMEFSGPKK
jgi:hypothetical protein